MVLSPSLALTTLVGGTQFNLSADKFLSAIDVNGTSVITITDNGTIQDIAITLTSAALKTAFNALASNTVFSATTKGTGTTTLYLNCNRVVKFYENDTADGTSLWYWNEYSEYNQYYEFTDTPSTINTACGTTIPTTYNGEGNTVYINNFFIRNTETVTGGSGNLTLTTSSVAAAGTGVTAIAGTLAGGTFTTAATILVDTIKPVSLATNAAGSSYNVGDTILTAGGTASTHATLTVTNIKAVTAPTVAVGGTGFTTGDHVSFTTDGTGTPSVFTVTASGGVVTSLSAIFTAGNYTVRPTLSATKAMTAVTGGGSGLTVNLVAADFGVLTTSITTAGHYTVGNTAFTQTSSSGAGTGATFNTVVFGLDTYHVTDNGEYTVAPSSPTSVTISGASGVTLTTTFSTSLTLIQYDGKQSATYENLYVNESPTELATLINAL